MGDSAQARSLRGTIVAQRFRLVREIAGGGMGFVFEAEHLRLGRPFALKILQLGQWNDELVRRFEREAQALARVRSPRVAQVTDFGVDPAVGPYYVMELVEGETLHDRLDRQRVIPTHEAVPIASELCEAVADVHEVGIVHRDLKPGNIGLPIAGPVGVKLLDFGLAASIDDAFLTRITQSHQVLGSLPYIAPEQLSGARPRAEQDLWALGIVLYEMVEGHLPFDQPSPAALMHAILTSPTPGFDRAPPPLQHVIRQLLIKDPLQRIASAREAAQVLAQIEGKRLPVTVPGHGGPQRTIPSSDLSSSGSAGVVLPASGVIPSQPHASQPQSHPPSQPPPRSSRSSAIPPTSHSSPAVMIPRTSETPSQPQVPPTSHAFPATSNPSNDFASYSSVRPPPAKKTPWLLWLIVGLVLGALTAVGIVWFLEAVPSSQNQEREQEQERNQEQNQEQAQIQDPTAMQTPNPGPSPEPGQGPGPSPEPDPDPVAASAPASASASASASETMMTSMTAEMTPEPQPAMTESGMERWTGGIIGQHP